MKIPQNINSKKKYILLLLNCFFTVLSFAQNASDNLTPRIALMPRTGEDSIVLRWVLDDANLLETGMQNGYVIKRATEVNGSWSAYSEIAHVTPWPRARWTQYLSTFKDTSLKAYKNFKSAYELSVNAKDYVPSDLSDLEAIQNAKAQNDLTFLFSILVSCTDAVSAEAMGLRWVDRKVESGKSYKYSIEFKTTLVNVAPTIIETIAEPYKTAAKSDITVIENELNIILRWPVSEQEPLIGYSIERSDNNGKSYKRMNEDIMLIESKTDSMNREIASLADTNVVLYQAYKYRIIGHTLFADETIVGIAEGMARDRTPVSAIFVPNPEPTGNKSAIITWELTAEPKDLKAFNIRKDNQIGGKFERILNKKPLSSKEIRFVDENVNLDDENYYLVETIDTAGNSFFSNPVYLVLVDSFPPAAPAWSMGSVDSNGLVTLIFKANKEKDFMGYRIQKANQADHEFSTFLETYSRNDTLNLRKMDTLFYDTTTLQTLTRNVYYRAFALDKHYNQSSPSQILILSRPDIVPPSRPVLRSIDVEENILQLNIIPSSSADVLHTGIFRKSTLNPELMNYATIGGRDSVFVDSFVVSDVLYEYALQAIDSNGLVSPFSIIMAAKPYDNGFRNGIDNLVAIYNQESQMVRLTWDYSFDYVKQDEKVFFNIYRNNTSDSSTLYTYKSIEYNGNNAFFNDEEIEEGKYYQYAIKVQTSKGAESLMSETKLVFIKENN